MRRTRSVVALVPLAALSLHAGAQTVVRERPVTAGPPVAEADLDALVRGNTQFALDLYAKLCGQA
jgi:hypothetical protein